MPLDMEIVKETLERTLRHVGEEYFLREIQNLQIAIYTAIGGGFLGEFAVNQPKQFYIDDRVGKLPYSRRKIYTMVKVYNLYLKIANLQSPPSYTGFHHCGVF